jgi:pSer/pThr/pTyr-binding forkhead associated (FHA) protein
VPTASPPETPRHIPPSTPASAAPAQPLPPPPAPPKPAPVQAAPPKPAPATPLSSQPTPSAPPASAPAKPAAARVALAYLEVLNEGPDKGKRIDIHGALTNIGRGGHNDLVLSSESVSDSHAKLQRRDAGWFIVDIDSTNGTYVGGRRVQGEQALTGAPDLRFGDVKVGFRPSAETIDEGTSTRAIVGVSAMLAKRVAERRATEGVARGSVQVPSPASVPSVVPPAPAPTPTSGRTPAWLWVGIVVVAIAAVAGYYFFLRGP